MRLCALIVCYYPDFHNILQTINQFISLSVPVFVVNNGSRLDSLPDSPYLHIINLCKNLGLGAPIASLQYYLESQGYTHLLYLDQDTRLLPHTAKHLVDFLNRSDSTIPSRFAAYNMNGVRYLGSNLSSPIFVNSGTIFRLSTLRVIGSIPFNLFLEGIDYEYALRLSRLNYTVLDISFIGIDHFSLQGQQYSIPFFPALKFRRLRLSRIIRILISYARLFLSSCAFLRLQYCFYFLFQSCSLFFSQVSIRIFPVKSSHQDTF